MLRSELVVTVALSKADLALVDHHAANAAIGGSSQVRTSATRRSFLGTDQSVGQLGELALSKYLGGTPLFYQLTRTIRDLNPHQGDAGGDLLATNVDVKCSLMRASQDPLKYRLLVRPRERHARSVYVLALVGPDVQSTGRVHLVGWCRDLDLPKNPAAEGPFEGAHVVPATKLYPLPPLEFNWLWNYQTLTVRPTG